MSSGAFSLFALYCGYSSWRNVFPRESMATTRYSGPCWRTRLMIVLKNPKTAETLLPSLSRRGLFMNAK